MRKYIMLRAAAVTLALMLAMAGCDNDFGVFQSIQTEKQQTGADIFKGTATKAVAEDGTHYYAAMSRIFHRAKGGTAWSVLEVNGSADYFCAGIACDDSSPVRLYAAAADKVTGVLRGIYWTQDSGATWHQLDTAALAGRVADNIFFAGGTLFAATHSGDRHSLRYWDGAAFAEAGAELADLDSSVKGMAWDGASFWAITSTRVFRGTVGGMAEETGSGTPSSSKTLCGIAADSAGAVRITTKDGLLYTSAGGSWSNATLKNGTMYGVLAEFPVSATAKRLVIAKHDSTFGYIEYDPSAASPVISGSKGALVPSESIYTTTIYDKPALAFYLSKDGTVMFAALAAQGTSGYSLYSNKFDGSAWAGWTAE